MIAKFKLFLMAELQYLTKLLAGKSLLYYDWHSFLNIFLNYGTVHYFTVQ